MLRKKLLWLVVSVFVEVALAILLDYVINVLISGNRSGFTPVSTVLITLGISPPVSFYLISQRFDLIEARRRLSESVVAKDAAMQATVEQRAAAEDARRDAVLAYDRLRESEALHRLVLNNQQDMIALWNVDYELVFASPACRVQLGYGPEEDIPNASVMATHPDDKALVFGIARSITLADGLKSAEFRLFTKDGTPVWVEGTFQRLEHDVYKLLTSARVINERKKLQQELTSAVATATAAAAAKSEFLANMTHELRTPLNAIIGFSGVLQSNTSLDAAAARQVRLIHESSQTLLHVVNDVLDYSKLEAGVEFDADAFDPMARARSVVEMLEPQCLAKGLTLTLHGNPSHGLLLGDSARLGQVLMNFISNAIKFTARGGVEVHVSQADTDLGRRLRMEVRDTGIGIRHDQLETIFGRFTQADASTSRQFGGTGLGLAICKKLVDAMGGRIGADSRVGAGATFWFEVELPVAAEAAPDALDEATPSDLGAGMKVLIVEDNAANRELIATLLAPLDVELTLAVDGVAAVEATQSSRFDLIFMDIQMPNMDGLTATRRIRAAEQSTGRRTPIIALTANVLPAEVARCLKAGMDDHLGKPIIPRQLIETMIRWSGPGPEPANAAAERA